MTTMTRHQIALQWHEDMQRDYYRSTDSTPQGGPQVFTAEKVDHPGAAMLTGTVVRMEYDTWQDLGCPVSITVTVEPGDRLNP